MKLKHILLLIFALFFSALTYWLYPLFSSPGQYSSVLDINSELGDNPVPTLLKLYNLIEPKIKINLIPSIKSDSNLITGSKFLNTSPVIISSDIVSAVNQERIKNHLLSFSVNGDYSVIAQSKADTLTKFNLFSHSLPIYASQYFNNLLRSRGIVNSGYRAEIITSGYFTSSADPLDNWLKSPEHRNLLLDSEYSRIGVGVSKYSNGMILVVGGLG